MYGQTILKIFFTEQLRLSRKVGWKSLQLPHRIGLISEICNWWQVTLMQVASNDWICNMWQVISNIKKKKFYSEKRLVLKWGTGGFYNHCVKNVQIRSYFWSVFSCIWTQYRKIRNRNNSLFGHFSRSDVFSQVYE